MDVGAGCEDLRARCPYFYEVACKVHEATGSEQVAAFVNNTFRARYKVPPLHLHQCWV
jgi:GINS complex subunit 3